MIKLRSQIESCFLMHIYDKTPKLIVNLSLENLCFRTYTGMYWLFVINSLMYVIKHFISILIDFMTSHKITFYFSLYVYEFWFSLHQYHFVLQNKTHVLP